MGRDVLGELLQVPVARPSKPTAWLIGPPHMDVRGAAFSGRGVTEAKITYPLQVWPLNGKKYGLAISEVLLIQEARVVLISKHSTESVVMWDRCSDWRLCGRRPPNPTPRRGRAARRSPKGKRVYRRLLFADVSGPAEVLREFGYEPILDFAKLARRRLIISSPAQEARPRVDEDEAGPLFAGVR